MNGSKKKAIVLGGTSAHIPLIVHLKRRGYTTYLVDYYENPVAREHADYHRQISTLDKEKVLQYAKEIGTDLVISTSIDQANVTACYIAETLGLPKPYSYETALQVTNKKRMKEIMVASGIPTAPYMVVNAGDKLPEAIQAVQKYPVIVKPADSNSSKGVRKAENKEELISGYNIAETYSRSGDVLVETCINGREICADCYVVNKQVQIYSVYEKFNLVMSRNSIQCFRSVRPAKVSEKHVHKLQDIIQRIADSFVLKHTSLFVQTMLDKDEFYVLEFGARAPGGLAQQATFLSTGYDLVEATIHSYTGYIEQKQIRKQNTYIYSTNSIYARPCVFGCVEGYKELLRKNIIEEFVPYKNQGMPIGPELNSSNRVAGFIIKSVTEQEMLEKTERALDTLEIYDQQGNAVMIKEAFHRAGNHHIFIKETEHQLCRQ